MNDILSKYNSLDPVSQKRISDFIDQMVNKMKGIKGNQQSYKKRILLTSTWTEHDGMLLSRWSAK